MAVAGDDERAEQRSRENKAGRSDHDFLRSQRETLERANEALHEEAER
jgi:hypothetical protein